MAKILVISYSLSGTTKRVAEQLADMLEAERRDIVDARPRRGRLRHMVAGFEAIAKGLPSIRIDCEPTDYELVVVGSPVWGRTMASPVRTFLFQYGLRLNRAAVFCTMGRFGAKPALDEMRALCHSPAAPTFSARQRDVRKQRHLGALREFATEVQRSVGLGVASRVASG